MHDNNLSLNKVFLQINALSLQLVHLQKGID